MGTEGHGSSGVGAIPFMNPRNLQKEEKKVLAKFAAFAKKELNV
jgi:hypothetical protein